MQTLIIKDITEPALKRAGEIIRGGGIVAFPTETVYGLGASALSEEAVRKIYVAKGRPSDNPLIVHLADAGDVDKVAREVPCAAKKLLEKFAPGPMTLILKKQPHIPDVVTAGLDTVGVRIPSDETAREFIRLSGVPVAAPSANLSGKPSPTRAEHVIHDMTGRVDAIICGGSSEVGVESTIIDMTGDVPTVLRPGGITPEDIAAVCGECRIDEHVLKAVSVAEQPKCPGMKYKHYAPEADVTVVEGSGARGRLCELVRESRDSGRRVGVLTYEKGDFGADLELTADGANTELASVLFDALRSFDREKIEVVFVEFKNDDGVGLAVKNRLYKAAGNKVIFVED